MYVANTQTHTHNAARTFSISRHALGQEPEHLLHNLGVVNGRVAKILSLQFFPLNFLSLGRCVCSPFLFFLLLLLG